MNREYIKKWIVKDKEICTAKHKGEKILRKEKIGLWYQILFQSNKN
jgi:hypothetical protein